MTHASETAEHLAPEQLNAFVDGELSPPERQLAEQHLATCHACTLRVLATTQLKTATADAAQHDAASPEALARLSAHLLKKPEKAARLYTFPAMRWAAMAACVLLGVALLSWRQIRQSNTLSAELLDQHLAVLSSGAVPEVVSTDRHTVKPWFQGKLPFSFNLPEVLPEDTVLKGGDLTFIDGQAAALLLFTIHKHQVSVFVTRHENTVGTMKATVRSGFSIRSAATRELTLTAVSDVNAAELDALVNALARAQSPP